LNATRFLDKKLTSMETTTHQTITREESGATFRFPAELPDDRLITGKDEQLGQELESIEIIDLTDETEHCGFCPRELGKDDGRAGLIYLFTVCHCVSGT